MEPKKQWERKGGIQMYKWYSRLDWLGRRVKKEVGKQFGI